MALTRGIRGASNPGPMSWAERSRSRAIFQAVFCKPFRPLSGWFPSGDRAENTAEVRPRPFTRRQPGRDQQAFDRRALGLSDLDDQRPAGREQRCRLRRDRPIGVEPVGAAVQRPTRVVGADLDRKRGDLGRRYIGRVGDDQVERAGQRRGIVAGDEMRAGADPEPIGVVARGAQRLKTEVGGDAAGARPFAQQRQQDQPTGGGAGSL